MSRDRWLIKPLKYVGGRLQSMARYLEDPDLLHVRRRGVPSHHYLNLNSKWLRDFRPDTVFDIGANVGQFAVAASRVFPQAQIYSFEPLPECFLKLEEQLEQIPNSKAFNVGVGASSGQLEFQRNDSTVSSSFRKMASAHKEAFPESTLTQMVTVRIERLDDLAQQVNIGKSLFIKIDTQGYEDKVLAGASSTLEKARWVLIETSFLPLYEGQPLFDDIYRHMREKHFQLHGSLEQLTNPQTGEILQSDFLFIRE